MRLPQLDIRSTPARLNITSELGKFDIRQKNAAMDIRSTRATIDVKTEQPVVMVDMTKTRDALDGGGTLSFMNRIYDQSGQFVIKAIERVVQDYAQIGDPSLDYDPIPELSRQTLFKEPPKLQVYGEASVLNLSYDVHIHEPEVNITPGKAEITVTPHKPDVEYHRGGVTVKVAQYPAVHITAPQIDLTL